MAREWSCSRRLTIYGEERGWWLQKITDGHVLGTDLSAVWTEKHERFLACHPCKMDASRRRYFFVVTMDKTSLSAACQKSPG
jgi:hypothetical protein